MSAFVDTSRVPVSAQGEISHDAVTPDIDVMYIRRKMDFGTTQRVQSAAVKLSAGVEQNSEANAQIDVGSWKLALAQYNILDWSGPSFAGRACTPKNIALLDPKFPVLEQALKSIGERNKLEGESESDPNA
ncbi:MAG TPA: hypothetical protein VFS21_33305 [Roseiflexaceae bacterium]|nr:hypothetical protein [Roseiflexaceae bacterium]